MAFAAMFDMFDDTGEDFVYIPRNGSVIPRNTVSNVNPHWVSIIRQKNDNKVLPNSLAKLLYDCKN